MTHFHKFMNNVALINIKLTSFIHFLIVIRGSFFVHGDKKKRHFMHLKKFDTKIQTSTSTFYFFRRHFLYALRIFSETDIYHQDLTGRGQCMIAEWIGVRRNETRCGVVVRSVVVSLRFSRPRMQHCCGVTEQWDIKA